MTTAARTLRLIEMPEYTVYPEEAIDTNSNTRFYTGEASDKVQGYRITAQERRDGKGAVGRMYGPRGLQVGFYEGDTWVECWMQLAADREKFLNQ